MTPDAWIQHAVLPGAGLYQPNVYGQPTFYTPAANTPSFRAVTNKLAKVDAAIKTGVVSSLEPQNPENRAKYEARNFKWIHPFKQFIKGATTSAVAVSAKKD